MWNYVLIIYNFSYFTGKSSKNILYLLLIDLPNSLYIKISKISNY